MDFPSSSCSSGGTLSKSRLRQLTLSIVYGKMNATQSSEYLKNARTKLICDLDAAFRLKLSTSLIIIDPSGNGRRLLIDEVLYSYNLVYSSSRSHTVDKLTKSATLPNQSNSVSHNAGSSTTNNKLNRNYVGVVNSELLESDWEALVDLAGQFLIRSEKRESSGYTKALEDLEFHFRQCRIEGRPAVVVLEGFHRFASKRQTLIYTLLDLMHKKDLLFIMIGITGRADVQYILEKRVLSRLNAQFVYLDSPSAEDTAKDLYQKCILPLTDSSVSKEPADVQRQILQNRIQFNKNVIALFGEYSDSSEYIRSTECNTAVKDERNSVTAASETLPRSPLTRSKHSLAVPIETDVVSVVDLTSPPASVHSTPSRRSVRILHLESPSGSLLPMNDETAVVSVPAVDASQGSNYSSPARMSQRSSAVKQRLPSEENESVATSTGSPIAFSQVAVAVTASSRKKLKTGGGDSSSSKSKPLEPPNRSSSSGGSLVPSDTLNITDILNQKKGTLLSTEETVNAVGTSSASVSVATLVKNGTMLPVIRVYKEWGYDINDFLRTLQFTIMGLTDDSPFLTKEMFCESMAQQMPRTIAESMSALDEVELYLLAALCYLHLHEQTSDHFTVAVLITNYDRMTSNLKDKRIQKIHLVTAIHSLCRKKFLQLFNNHSGIKCAADTGLSSLTNQTIVFLAVSVQEVKKAFLNKHIKQQAAIGGLECRRAQPIIRVQERVRQLLENPTVNNLYTADNSTVLQAAAGMSFL